MRLSKSSLYNSFGSKRRVLTEVLEHYASQAAMLRTLLERKGLRPGLRTLLESIASDNRAGRMPAGQLCCRARRTRQADRRRVPVRSRADR